MGLRDKVKKYKSIGEGSVNLSDLFNVFLKIFNTATLNLPVAMILTEIKKKFNISNVLINFIDEHENIYKLIGESGIKDHDALKFNFNYDSYFLKAINGPIYIADLITEPYFKKELEFLNLYEFQIIFPLFHDDDLKGFITLGKKEDGSGFNLHDMTELTRFGGIIGNALYNFYVIYDSSIKIFDLNKEHKADLEAIETLKNIHLSEDLNEALTIFFRSVKDHYKINSANLIIKDLSTGSFKTAKSIGLSEATDAAFQMDEMDDIFNTIIEIGESMDIPDYKTLSIYNNGISQEDKDKIKMFYCMPIKLGEDCLGFFNIFECANADESLPHDIIKPLSVISLGVVPYIINESK